MITQLQYQFGIHGLRRDMFLQDASLLLVSQSQSLTLCTVWPNHLLRRRYSRSRRFGLLQSLTHGLVISIKFRAMHFTSSHSDKATKILTGSPQGLLTTPSLGCKLLILGEFYLPICDRPLWLWSLREGLCPMHLLLFSMCINCSFFCQFCHNVRVFSLS